MVERLRSPPTASFLERVDGGGGVRRVDLQNLFEVADRSGDVASHGECTRDGVGVRRSGRSWSSRVKADRVGGLALARARHLSVVRLGVVRIDRERPIERRCGTVVVALVTTRRPGSSMVRRIRSSRCATGIRRPPVRAIQREQECRAVAVACAFAASGRNASSAARACPWASPLRGARPRSHGPRRASDRSIVEWTMASSARRTLASAGQRVCVAASPGLRVSVISSRAIDRPCGRFAPASGRSRSDSRENPAPTESLRDVRLRPRRSVSTPQTRRPDLHGRDGCQAPVARYFTT